MTSPLHHPDEPTSNTHRDLAAAFEPRSLRTFTPTQAVLARSAGIYHWTPEGRRLYDFTSGVLVANLGHNPTAWHERFLSYLGWPGCKPLAPKPVSDAQAPPGFFLAPPMNAYNAITWADTEASARLLD